MNNACKAFCLCLLPIAALQAGVIITNSHQKFSNSKSIVSTSTLTLGDRGVRMESGSQAPGSVFIYRKDKDLCWVLNSAENSYVEITRAELTAMTAQIKSAMAQMKGQMAQLPPEQRAMMESMMKSMGGQVPQMTYQKIASGEKVGDWSCDKYDGLDAGNKVIEVWVTDWKRLGLTQADLDGLTALAQFFEEFSKDLGSFFKPGTKAEGYDGMPVKTVMLSSGQPVAQTQLSEIVKTDPATALFEVPAGFVKKSLAGKSGLPQGNKPAGNSAVSAPGKPAQTKSLGEK
ncbi:MAG: DUF4412 domain-containing protein [Chitinispirillaceae bacterium]|jgi:hypothetical protein|nr:DUF4412 domain-containing protein [Chitinispirillaceae bacterium]